MRQIHTLLTAVVIALATVGCWGHRKTTAVEPSAPATLRVENRHWLDVDIFLLQYGQRSRLGSVTAASTRVITLPSAVVLGRSPIRLAAAAIGSSSTVVTETIVVQPGTRVDWTLQPNLGQSSLSVY